MATQKAIKLKEDAHRKHLEDSFLVVLAALEQIKEQQEQMLEMLRKLSPHQGLKRRVK